MKKDWEIYRDTGILGAYRPEQVILRLMFADTPVTPWVERVGKWDPVLRSVQVFINGEEAIPPTSVRLRLACLWPVLIGLKTFGHLVRNPRWLEPGQASKIRRAQVQRAYDLMRGILVYKKNDEAGVGHDPGLRRGHRPREIIALRSVTAH